MEMRAAADEEEQHTSKTTLPRKIAAPAGVAVAAPMKTGARISPGAALDIHRHRPLSMAATHQPRPLHRAPWTLLVPSRPAQPRPAAAPYHQGREPRQAPDPPSDWRDHRIPQPPTRGAAAIARGPTRGAPPPPSPGRSRLRRRPLRQRRSGMGSGGPACSPSGRTAGWRSGLGARGWTTAGRGDRGGARRREEVGAAEGGGRAWRRGARRGAAAGRLIGFRCGRKREITP